MSWIQIQIETNFDKASFYETSLLDLGAVSVTFIDGKNQPIYEPELGTIPIWSMTNVIALFKKDTDLEILKKHLKLLTLVDSANFSVSILNDENWESRWLKYFRPIQYNNNFWVVPESIDPPNKNAINLIVNPGLAFGTGTHPTTNLCLKWLSQNNLKDKIILDFGCGSGILSIASILLGSKKAIAVDIDNQALISTRNNANLNAIPKNKLDLYHSDETPKLNTDIIIANILLKPLLELKEILLGSIKKDGLIVFSGILKEQVSKLINTYKDDCDLKLYEIQDEWACVVGKKK